VGGAVVSHELFAPAGLEWRHESLAPSSLAVFQMALGAGRVDQVLECLSRKPEALSSNHSPVKKIF
jgi:hypothetical protein